MRVLSIDVGPNNVQGVQKMLPDPISCIGFCIGGYSTSVQFNGYTVTQLYVVYNIRKQSSENFLNNQIGPYFPNTLYLKVYVLFKVHWPNIGLQCVP